MYMRPYQWTERGPSWMATGSNSGYFSIAPLDPTLNQRSKTAFFKRWFRHGDMPASFVDARSMKNGSGPEPAFSDCVVDGVMDDSFNLLSNGSPAAPPI